MRTLEIIPDLLPVSLDLAKSHLRVGDDPEVDTLITAKLEMAVAIAEDKTNRHIRRKRVEVFVENPKERSSLPVYCHSVEDVSCDGVKLQSPGDYAVILNDFSTKLYVTPKYQSAQLTVSMIMGYDDKNCPPAISAAILFILGTLYDNESDEIVGRSTSKLSLTVDNLLKPWRISPYNNV